MPIQSHFSPAPFQVAPLTNVVPVKNVDPAAGRAPDGRQVQLTTSDVKRPPPYTDIAPPSAPLAKRLQPISLDPPR